MGEPLGFPGTPTALLQTLGCDGNKKQPELAVESPYPCPCSNACPPPPPFSPPTQTLLLVFPGVRHRITAVFKKRDPSAAAKQHAAATHHAAAAPARAAPQQSQEAQEEVINPDARVIRRATAMCIPVTLEWLDLGCTYRRVPSSMGHGYRWQL